MTINRAIFTRWTHSRLPRWRIRLGVSQSPPTAPANNRAQVTYNTADGQSIKQAEQTTDETVLVLPKPLVPEIAVEVNAKVVNFVDTPLVEVDVNYEDRAHDIAYEETLGFSGPDPQKFRIQVDKDSPREYSITVTYYLSDGKVVVRPAVSLDKSKIVVPRYVAGA